MKSQTILKQEHKFVCPNCHKEHHIKDAHINAVLVKEESHVTYHGSFNKDHITTTYLKVRFCPDCKNVRLRNKMLRHTLYFLFGPLIIMSIISLFNWRPCFTVSGYFMGLFILFMFYVPAVKIFRELLSPSLNKPIIKRAIDGNAVE